MSVPKKTYDQMTKEASPKSPVFKDCCFAFLVGGFICLLGQVLGGLYKMCGTDVETAKTAATVTLIFLAALLTAIGVFDDIAKVAGAGTLVPITGFANSMVSPAVEFKTEGFVLGMGAKMFVIAGPVLVYGVGVSVLYGIVLWLIQIL